MRICTCPVLMQGAQIRKHINGILGSRNLREAVKLPTVEDLNEWLAVNSNSFYLSLLHACVHLHFQNVQPISFYACQSVRFSISMCYSHVLSNLCSFFFKKKKIQLMLKCKNTFPNQFLLYCSSCMSFKSEMWFFFFLSLSFTISAVDFFNQVNLLYGTLTEFCTNDNCPTMTAGPKYVIILKPLIFFPIFFYGIEVLSASHCLSYLAHVSNQCSNVTCASQETTTSLNFRGQSALTDFFFLVSK